VAELKSTTTRQIEQIRAAGSALRQLREGLWASDEPAEPGEPDALPPNVS